MSNPITKDAEAVPPPPLVELFSLSLPFSIPLALLGNWVGPILSLRSFIPVVHRIAYESPSYHFLPFVFATTPLLFWLVGRLVHRFNLSSSWYVVGCPIFTVFWCCLIYL